VIGYAFHPEAALDLEEIWNYIADDSVQTADAVIASIEDALNSLTLSPHQGHRRPDLTSKPIRFKVVRGFLIAYAPERKPLWVLTIVTLGA
jgi:plasmid stabilization system protein ParE